MKIKVELIAMEDGKLREIKFGSTIYILSAIKPTMKKPKFHKRKYKHKMIKPKEEGIECSHCGSSNYIKYGKKDSKQLYQCKRCERKFIDNKKELELKKEIKEYASALHSKNVSYRKISKKILRKYKLNITHSTVMHWVKKEERNEKYKRVEGKEYEK